MTKCTQQGCEGRGTHRVTWPGYPESIVCDSHRVMMGNIASAMGFALDFQPLTMIVTHPPDAPLCERCEGCGKIANSEQGEPWTAWESLSPGEDLAVKMGVVKPLPCPSCNGLGIAATVEPDVTRPDVTRWGSHVICFHCWHRSRPIAPPPDFTRAGPASVESVCCYCGTTTKVCTYVRDKAPSFCKCTPEER